jgi:fatty-acyl-CoA synthase
MLFTSGSTATPKACMLTHQGIVRNACHHVDRLEISTDDRWLSGMPFFHAGGLIWGLTSMLVSGATLVAQEAFDAGDAMRLAEDEQCTYLHAVDTMCVKIMEHPRFHPRRLRTLTRATTIGPPELLWRVHDVMGIKGIESKWGISEGYGNLTLCSPDDPLQKRIESVGRGFPGLEYDIRNEGGRALPSGSVGEIAVRGSAMEGYYRDPVATAAIIDEEGWIRTGDLGRFDSDGFLYFMGRTKQMLKVGGENVSALEVETFLLTYKGVEMAFVVPGRHARLGEAPVAFLVSKPGQVIDIDDLTRHCKQHLAAFKVPVRFVSLPASDLPLTGIGKISKPSLIQLADARFGVLS